MKENTYTTVIIGIMLLLLNGFIFWQSNSVYIGENKIGLVYNQDYHAYTGDYFGAGHSFVWPFGGNKVIIEHTKESAAMGFISVKGAFQLVEEAQTQNNIMFNTNKIKRISSYTVEKWLKLHTPVSFIYNLRKGDFPELEELWKKGRWRYLTDAPVFPGEEE